MSDHGFGAYSRKFEKTKRDDSLMYKGTKTVLFFQSMKHKKTFYDEIFSLKNFYDLIAYLLDLSDDSTLSHNYAKIQILPFYAKNFIDKVIEKKGKLSLPSKGIITKDEIYLIDYCGNEVFQTYKSINSVENRINEVEYQKCIDELRSLCDNDFHDIFEQPKFEYAKQKYREQGLI